MSVLDRNCLFFCTFDSRNFDRVNTLIVILFLHSFSCIAAAKAAAPYRTICNAEAFSTDNYEFNFFYVYGWLNSALAAKSLVLLAVDLAKAGQNT